MIISHYIKGYMSRLLYNKNHTYIVLFSILKNDKYNYKILLNLLVLCLKLVSMVNLIHTLWTCKLFRCKFYY